MRRSFDIFEIIGQFIGCLLSIPSLCDEDGERVNEQVENR